MSLVSEFSIGFWHPFGPHGGEAPKQILARKQEEIEANGWTLWSFQIRRTLAAWHKVILDAEPHRVLVFCSEGKGSTDPTGAIQHCSHYLPVGTDSFLPIPIAVKIPHPMGRKTEASAFIVEKIDHPLNVQPLFPVQWYVPRESVWRSDSLPTRGEYLLQHGGTNCLRKCSAVLVLKAPYLAVVATEA